MANESARAAVLARLAGMGPLYFTDTGVLTTDPSAARARVINGVRSDHASGPPQVGAENSVDRGTVSAPIGATGHTAYSTSPRGLVVGSQSSGRATGNRAGRLVGHWGR